MLKRQLKSRENLGLLWDLLQSEGWLEGLAPGDCAKLQLLMIDHAQVVANQPGQRFIDSNRELLRRVTNEINGFAGKPAPAPELPMRDVSMLGLSAPEDVSSGRRRLASKQKLDADLEMRRKEFEDMITVNTPETPSFEDEEAPLKGNLEDLLAAFKAERDQTLG